MPSVPYATDPQEATKRFYVGLIFDDYTPQVESQIMRDCLQMQQVADRDEEVVVVCDSSKPDRLLESLGMRRVPTAKLAKLWILYKTGEWWPEAPNWTSTEVHRDLYVPKKDPKLLRQVDEAEANGYYLPPQGRLSPDTLSLERPAPNGELLAA
jgi:hypothetical protein